MARFRKRITRLTGAMQFKLFIIFAFIVLAFFVLVGRLIYINAQYGNEYSKIVLSSQKNDSVTIPFERGKIYDRNKRTLVTNEKIYSLILEPKNILDKDGKYKNATLKALHRFFGYDLIDLDTVITRNKDSYYVVYRKGLTYGEVSEFQEFLEKADEPESGKSEEEIEEIREAKKVRGINFEESYKRVYKYNSLACRALGFTSAGNVGNWGIEQSYNDELNGVNGRKYYYFDETLVLEESVIEAKDGNNIVSTIDMDIQQVIEKHLATYDKVVGSKMTNVLVMDPQSGEILGMASSNPYDLNKPMDEKMLRKIYSNAEIADMKAYTEELEEEKKKETEEGTTEKKTEKKKNKKRKTIYDGFYELWRNYIISNTNEPGSTFKPFTVAAGLESGILKGDENYYCSGSMPVGRRVIGCSHVHGAINLKQAVAQSCNVAMMNIAFKEGVDIFYSYQNQFGFGRKTGVDLPGEAYTENLVYNAKNYSSDATLATNAFGQNFNCTMMQMAAGFCSLINGGNYYLPHIVKQIQNSDGAVVKDIDKTLIRKTVSEETSRTLRSFMKDTVENGTGQKGQIAGYSIGGKTGTAEKIPRNKEDYYISFIGFTPVKNPKVLIYVTIDEPHVKKQDNAALAVQLERACMKEIVELMGIEPTEDATPSAVELEEEKTSIYE